MPQRGKRGGPPRLLFAAAALLLSGCSRHDPSIPAATTPVAAATAVRVLVLDAEDRPAPEGRPAVLTAGAFDPRGRLRPEALMACPERLRVVVEDPGLDRAPSVTLVAPADGSSLVLPLSGPAGRRTTTPFLLVGDRDDAAAASGAALVATPGTRLEVRYREAVAALKAGPSVIQEIPVRVIAVGAGFPAAGDLEKILDGRFRQANAVWEPFGRRFVRGPVSRIETFRGLVLIRGRAAGVDDRGRPSHSGLRVDGRDLMIPCPWREDGAPLSPKAAARALIEKAGSSYQVQLFDSLAGDRDAVLLQWARRDGGAVAVEALAASNDLSQAVMPLQIDPAGDVEVAPEGIGLTLEEAALLASGKKGASEGFDLFVVPGLRSLREKPAFKVYPEGRVPAAAASCAVLSWSVVDGSGKYPYALARVFGELLLPPSLRPGPEDTLFANPLSESPGVDARKRLGAATGARIAERARGLPRIK